MSLADELYGVISCKEVRFAQFYTWEWALKRWPGWGATKEIDIDAQRRERLVIAWELLWNKGPQVLVREAINILTFNARWTCLPWDLSAIYRWAVDTLDAWVDADNPAATANTSSSSSSSGSSSSSADVHPFDALLAAQLLSGVTEITALLRLRYERGDAAASATADRDWTLRTFDTAQLQQRAHHDYNPCAQHPLLYPFPRFDAACRKLRNVPELSVLVPERPARAAAGALEKSYGEHWPEPVFDLLVACHVLCSEDLTTRRPLLISECHRVLSSPPGARPATAATGDVLTFEHVCSGRGAAAAAAAEAAWPLPAVLRDRSRSVAQAAARIPLRVPKKQSVRLAVPAAAASYPQFEGKLLPARRGDGGGGGGGGAAVYVKWHVNKECHFAHTLFEQRAPRQESEGDAAAAEDAAIHEGSTAETEEDGGGSEATIEEHVSECDAAQPPPNDGYDTDAQSNLSDGVELGGAEAEENGGGSEAAIEEQPLPGDGYHTDTRSESLDGAAHCSAEADESGGDNEAAIEEHMSECDAAQPPRSDGYHTDTRCESSGGAGHGGAEAEEHGGGSGATIREHEPECGAAQPPRGDGFETDRRSDDLSDGAAHGGTAIEENGGGNEEAMIEEHEPESDAAQLPPSDNHDTDGRSEASDGAAHGGSAIEERGGGSDAMTEEHEPECDAAQPPPGDVYDNDGRSSDSSDGAAHGSAAPMEEEHDGHPMPEDELDSAAAAAAADDDAKHTAAAAAADDNDDAATPLAEHCCHAQLLQLPPRTPRRPLQPQECEQQPVEDSLRAGSAADSDSEPEQQNGVIVGLQCASAATTGMHEGSAAAESSAPDVLRGLTKSPSPQTDRQLQLEAFTTPQPQPAPEQRHGTMQAQEGALPLLPHAHCPQPPAPVLLPPQALPPAPPLLPPQQQQRPQGLLQPPSPQQQPLAAPLLQRHHESRPQRLATPPWHQAQDEDRDEVLTPCKRKLEEEAEVVRVLRVVHSMPQATDAMKLRMIDAALPEQPPSPPASPQQQPAAEPAGRGFTNKQIVSATWDIYHAKLVSDARKVKVMRSLLGE